MKDPDNVRLQMSQLMKRRVIIVVQMFLIFLQFAGCAQSRSLKPQIISGDAISAANQLYENADYAQAVEHYKFILETGVNDGIVYYNLANAYFKLGDLGRAILNYRRAQILLPRDPDVEANLELARSQTLDRLDRDGNGFVGFITNIMVGWTTLDEVAGVALGLWIALCMCIVLVLITRYQRRWLHRVIIFLTIGLLFSLLSMGIRLVDAQRAHGVVVAPNIEVRSGPGTSYLTEFTLHSGTEVRILEQRSNWSRISLPGNLQGWIPDEVVEEL